MTIEQFIKIVKRDSKMPPDKLEKFIRNQFANGNGKLEKWRDRKVVALYDISKIPYSLGCKLWKIRMKTIAGMPSDRARAFITIQVDKFIRNK